MPEIDNEIVGVMSKLVTTYWFMNPLRVVDINGRRVQVRMIELAVEPDGDVTIAGFRQGSGARVILDEASDQLVHSLVRKHHGNDDPTASPE